MHTGCTEHDSERLKSASSKPQSSAAFIITSFLCIRSVNFEKNKWAGKFQRTQTAVPLRRRARSARVSFGAVGGGKGVAFLDQAAERFSGDAAVQHNADPVLFVHVIGGKHRGISAAPKIDPLRLGFYVDPNMPLALKNKGKGLLVGPVAHHGPVWVVKGIIFICAL